MPDLRKAERSRGIREVAESLFRRIPFWKKRQQQAPWEPAQPRGLQADLCVPGRPLFPRNLAPWTTACSSSTDSHARA